MCVKRTGVTDGTLFRQNAAGARHVNTYSERGEIGDDHLLSQSQLMASSRIIGCLNNDVLDLCLIQTEDCCAHVVGVVEVDCLLSIELLRVLPDSVEARVIMLLKKQKLEKSDAFLTVVTTMTIALAVARPPQHSPHSECWAKRRYITTLLRNKSTSRVWSFSLPRNIAQLRYCSLFQKRTLGFAAEVQNLNKTTLQCNNITTTDGCAQYATEKGGILHKQSKLCCGGTKPHSGAKTNQQQQLEVLLPN